MSYMLSKSHLDNSMPCFGLVDCNNFYVSCERIFNPGLHHRPVIVLSNNDGCVVSRSNEAKALGIQMGQPYFQIASLCKSKKVNVFSSNFALYGDISNRVMMTLKQYCPDMEIYSVDEAFLRLDKMSFCDAFEYALKIREIILHDIGIPVSIGIAPTKTLAKMASVIAKKNHAISKNNVCDLRNAILRDAILSDFPVESIWGVGKKSAAQLHYWRITTAKKLCEQDIAFLKKRFSVMMSRVVLELQGTPCLTLEEVRDKQNITCSRSFSKPVTVLSELYEAMSVYVARACEKARSHGLKARAISVYIRTSLFQKNEMVYSASDAQSLLHPSNDTCYMTAISHELIKNIFREGFLYQKAGIILSDLISTAYLQNDLFHITQDDNEGLMNVVDGINHQFGSHTIFLASEGFQKNWEMKSELRSPRYTTCWKELLEVK